MIGGMKSTGTIDSVVTQMAKSPCKNPALVFRTGVSNCTCCAIDSGNWLAHICKSVSGWAAF